MAEPYGTQPLNLSKHPMGSSFKFNDIQGRTQGHLENFSGHPRTPNGSHAPHSPENFHQISNGPAPISSDQVFHTSCTGP
ncbi:unnamed protein product [Prunus armeniaca]|uniref:Uncharacterized protein n=1 Tax=Prunus armeniaca TaxID=36596 RepID=A0A6J5XQD3_PRUAR|nr:unnamed protein product [Prunus armeniaca]